MTEAADELLPTLRPELRLLPGGPTPNGAPSWIIHDPLRNSFFRININNFQLLTVWRNGTIASFCAHASKNLQRPVGGEEVGALVEFINKRSLSTRHKQSGHEHYFKDFLSAKSTLLGVLIHKYLFVKIPLFRPQRVLELSWPLVSWLFTRAAMTVIALCGLIALYFVSNQWDIFVTTFMDFLSVEGLALYLISLVFLKALHELGHAFLMIKYRLQVPVIGLAFLVLFPILYTDTSDAWKLRSRSKRLMIDLGGIFVELSVACIATLLWVFLPDGPMRSIAFTTATLSWVLSLAINLNPFMRFDGYYVLSDFIGIENLQERAFALGRWRMRELLFGLGQKPPEFFGKSMQRLLCFYAYGTWIYRFFLFLGIALLVYSFFIKVIGIFLFAIEIVWFVLLPVYREFKIWFGLRRVMVKTKRTWITFGFVAGLILMGCVPWSTSVRVPSLLTANNRMQLFVPEAAKVVDANLHPGRVVQAGERLILATSPQLEHEFAMAKLRLQVIDVRLKRISADANDRSVRQVLAEQRNAETERLAGITQRREQLSLIAPITGRLTNVDHDIASGSWVRQTESIGLLVSESKMLVEGVIAEEEVHRLVSGNEGVFYPDDILQPPIKVRLLRIDGVAQKTLSKEILADLNGGIVSTVPDTKDEGDGELKMRKGWFGAHMEVVTTDSEKIHNMEVRGIAIIEGVSQSFFSRGINRVLSVLVREFGL